MSHWNASPSSRLRSATYAGWSRNLENYHAAASGFLAEIDRMQLDVREYLSLHPAELTEAT